MGTSSFPHQVIRLAFDTGQPYEEFRARYEDAVPVLDPDRLAALAEAGASFIAIPAAFTQQTGEAHWHILTRARAIENGCFIFAAAQGGRHEHGRETFGHSIVVDPWGRVIAEGGSDPGVIMADIDPSLVATVRARIPSLQHGRRFELVEPIAEPAHLHLVRAP